MDHSAVVPINEPERACLGLFRAALSEPTHEERLLAIGLVRQDVLTRRLELLDEEDGPSWVEDAANAGLVQWAARTSAKRQEAAYAFSEVAHRYEADNERRLNIAEHIGFDVFLSIQDGEFKGLQTADGILYRVSEEARATEAKGARDKDVLRKIWNTYRSVVHLGMAITYCEDNPDQGLDVLHLAERFRECLCSNCPKGTKKPYVDAADQLIFVYISRTSGPRYQNRGLPFY